MGWFAQILLLGGGDITIQESREFTSLHSRVFENSWIEGWFHMGPRVTRGQFCAISAVESMEVGTYHFTRRLKSLVSTMTWIPTWQHFLEVR